MRQDLRADSARRPLNATLIALAATVLLLIAGAPAWAMTLTFVRHAESQANADGVIDTSVPGPGLSTDGVQQAQDIAPILAANNYDGIYVSSMLRTQQTAQPLIDLLPEGTEYVILPGLREIGAGIFEGSSERDGLGRLGYALAPALWTLGARFVPVLGGEDGNAFDARVDDAIRQIHANGDENAVAFSHGATIMFWVMMNVDNPDLLLLLSHQLGNTETVVIEGSPEEGWTLVSWAGIPVNPEPSLVTKVFVNVRDLVVAPQTAIYEIGQALATGDISQVVAAIVDGVTEVASTVVEFVPDMLRDIAGAAGGSMSLMADEHADTTQLSATRVTEEAPEAGGRASDSKEQSEESEEPLTVTGFGLQKRNGATDLTHGNKVSPITGLTKTPLTSGDLDEEPVEGSEDDTDAETGPVDGSPAGSVENGSDDNDAATPTTSTESAAGSAAAA